MNLYEYTQVQGNTKRTNTPVIMDGVSDPFEWLWAEINDTWQPVKQLCKIRGCDCIGACAKDILPSGVKCIDNF